MKPGLTVMRCTKCSAGFFPFRLMCPKCHGAEFREDRVDHGVVEEITTIRHVLSHVDWQPQCLASVRTNDGQLVIAGLAEPLPAGTAVKLWEDEAALRATPITN